MKSTPKDLQQSMAIADNSKDSLLARWKNRNKSVVSTNPIDKAPHGAKIPLSHAQRRLWFLQQLYPKSAFYNYSEAYTFQGALNQNVLKKAIQKIFEDHDILRTQYHLENDKIYQSVNPILELEFTEYDLSKTSEEAANLKAQNIIESEAKKAFHLSSQCLIRPCLIRISPRHHILQLTMHHIITDEWTMKLFRQELSKNYEQLLTIGCLDEKKDQLQYTDYAYWENNNQTNHSQLEYWKNKLSGDIPILNLPTDFSRPVQTKFEGNISKTQRYSEQLSQKVLNLAKNLGATPFVLMLSVYYIFLNKYSGQKDLLVGSPITLRDDKLTESLFGFFLNTLVLRAEIDNEIPFDEFVNKIRKNTLDAFKNKNFPFGELVKTLNVERTLSTNPFFQVMFVYNDEIKMLDFGNGLQVSHRFLDPKVSKFDLTIFITEEKGVLSSTFEYSSELFEASTIERFQGYFKTLLEGIVLNPQENIFELNMIPPKEKELLIKQEPPFANSFSNFTGIHEIIESVSQKTPDAIAVTFNNNSVSYKQLNDRANTISQNLLAHLEQHNKIVGLCIDRSVEMVVGMLAILKAGCAYLPIDPEYPKERIDFMLNDAGVNVILTEQKLENLFSQSHITLLNVDDTENTEYTPNISTPKVKPTDLAYVIYTSGSTGKPKGVPITHQNIITSTAGRLSFYDDNPNAFLLMSSISFDSSKAGIFWTLCTGGNLVVTEKRIEQDIDKIGNLINQHSVTHTLMLPSLYNLILQHIDSNNLTSLKTVVVAGEACGKHILVNHFKKLPELKLYNEYGPTEATVWCVAHKIEKEDIKNATIPIGKPVANAKIYLLDELSNPVPFGSIGEIYIGGPALTTGYINRLDLNEAAFFENPFNPNEKLYKTGDIGRYSNNKTIEFLGRADQQIKIRGFRVELSEIEKVINSYSDSIKNTYVVVEDEFDGVNIQMDNPSNLEFVLEKIDDEDLERIIASIEALGDNQKKYLLNQLKV